MKHIILTLLIITMSLGIGYAQTIYGIKGGMNISRISGDDGVPSADSHIGVHVGIMMQHNLMKSLIIQPELIYTQKGYNYKFNALSVYTNVDDSFDYIELPILAKLNLAVPNTKIQPYVGLAVSYLINAKSKVKVTSGSTTVTTNNNVSDDINKLAAGVVVGAEVVVMNKYLAGLRYNFGLTNIYHQNNPSGTGNDVRNGVFMLSLGYLFN